MGCGTTTSNESATDAKCASSCSGVCSVGAIGCTTGWQEWPAPEALLRPDACETTQPSSVVAETEASPETGAEPAVRARVWRWMVGLSVGFWVAVTLLGLRGCLA